VQGPLLGYLFDANAKGLRPILGVLGSSRLGPAIDAGVSFDQAVVSRKHDYALGQAAGSGDVFVVRLDRVPAVALPLGSLPAPAAFVASPGGSSAALYFAATSRMQVFTGLPESPTLAREIDASAVSSLSTMAVSDDGQCVVAIADGSATVFSQAGARVLEGLAAVADAHFAIGTQDVYLSDVSNQQVLAIFDASGAARRKIIAGAVDGISQPVAIALSPDNARLFVANADAGNIGVITLNAPPGAITFTGCDCSPTRLEPLIGNALFRVTDGSDGPMLVFDAISSQLTFIPADLASQAVPTAFDGRRQ
jgi:hypothetical protein